MSEMFQPCSNFAHVSGRVILCRGQPTESSFADETVSIGSSKFCELFTEEDFRAFEYAFDLSVRAFYSLLLLPIPDSAEQFYGDCGLGSPVSI